MKEKIWPSAAIMGACLMLGLIAAALIVRGTINNVGDKVATEVAAKVNLNLTPEDVEKLTSMGKKFADTKKMTIQIRNIANSIGQLNSFFSYLRVLQVEGELRQYMTAFGADNLGVMLEAGLAIVEGEAEPLYERTGPNKTLGIDESAFEEMKRNPKRVKELLRAIGYRTQEEIENGTEVQSRSGSTDWLKK